ncbi:MAG TPA: hypothetical protein VIE44_07955 [Methylomirabilota bacterium]
MTIDKALRLAAADAAHGAVTFPADLHGFPGIAHGGAVAALFHRLALPRPPVALRVELLRGVPTATPLALRTGSEGATARLALSQNERTLAVATFQRTDLVPPDVAPLRARWAADRDGHEEVPGTATCLACGSANPLGLGVRFLVNGRFLWKEYVPPATYRTQDGAHPALALILMDELGWWLGALAQRECGVTTDVRITLFEALPFAPLLVIGDRTAVAIDADDPRGRYSRASGVLLGPGGTLLAAAEVRFGGSRAYTRRLIEPFLSTTPVDDLARWFPSVRELARKESAG